MIAVRDFVHAQDKKLTKKIFADTPVKTWLDNLHEDHLDEVCEYVYSASLPEITDKKIIKMHDVACQKFGINSFVMYYTRNYDYNISCVGYNFPAVLIPAILIEDADEEILQARLYSAAAAIAAGHPKLKFFLWMAENMSGVVSIPIIGTALLSILYEWNRVRQFTLDRAVFMATEDFELALKNILYGVVPQDILQNFKFDEANNSFDEQTRRYFNTEDPTEIIGKIFSYTSDYSWLPRRYDELEKFYYRNL